MTGKFFSLFLTNTNFGRNFNFHSNLEISCQKVKHFLHQFLFLKFFSMANASTFHQLRISRKLLKFVGQLSKEDDKIMSWTDLKTNFCFSLDEKSKFECM